MFISSYLPTNTFSTVSKNQVTDRLSRIVLGVDSTSTLDEVIDLASRSVTPFLYRSWIKERIDTAENEALREFLLTLLSEENGEGQYNWIFSFLSLERIKTLAAGECLAQDDLIDLEVIKKRCGLTEEEQAALEKKLECFNVVANFFPSFLATLQTAFSFFQPGNTPRILWECSLLLGLYAAVFRFPIDLVRKLTPMIGQKKAVAIVSLAALFGTACLYCYQKWLSRPPSILSFGVKDISREIRKGKRAGCVARQSEINRMQKAAFGGRRHTLIIGSPGTGKTKLIAGAVEKMSLEHPDYRIYPIHPVISEEYKKDFSSTPQAKINQLVKDCGRHASQSIFILDEKFGKVMSGPSSEDWNRYFCQFLEEEPVTCWFTIDRVAYEQMLTDDLERKNKAQLNESAKHGGIGEALLDRFEEVIELDVEGCRNKTLQMVTSEMKRLRKEVVVDEDVPEKAVASVGIKDKVREPVNLIGRAITRVRNTLIDPGKSERLIKLEEEMEHLRTGCCEDLTELREKENEIKEETSRLEREKQKLHAIHRQGMKILQRKRDMYQLALDLKRNPNQKKKLKQLYAIKYVELPLRQNVLDRKRKEIDEKEFPTKVTAALLEQMAHSSGEKGKERAE